MSPKRLILRSRLNSVCPGSRASQLADLFERLEIGDIADSAVAVDVEHATFEDWWEPFTLGVAPSVRSSPASRPIAARHSPALQGEAPGATVR